MNTLYASHRVGVQMLSCAQTWPGFGYMARSTVLTRHTLQQQALEDEDTSVDVPDAATASVDTEPLICQQYVVYSASFQVPSFYFTMHSTRPWTLLTDIYTCFNARVTEGEPLSLDDILCTTLFRVSSFRGAENTGFALTQPTSMFPLLSQGEHPTLGMPCWYLHPCETAVAVEEIVAEKGSGANVIEGWLLIVGNVVELGNA